MKIYLAYGSNLCKAAMRGRCPGARPVGKLWLTDARLVFRGVADVEYCPGSRVPVGAWLITRDDERALDHYEGVASGRYRKSEEIVVSHRGRERPALIYLMRSRGVYPPSQHYLDVIRRGYQDFGIDPQPLDEAVARSFDEKEPDAQTRRRRARQKEDHRERLLARMPESAALTKIELERRRQPAGAREEESTP